FISGRDPGERIFAKKLILRKARQPKPVQDSAAQLFRSARDDCFRHFKFLGQPFMAFKSIGDHERMHAGLYPGKEILVFIAADITACRVDIKTFSGGAELDSLVLTDGDMNEKIQR